MPDTLTMTSTYLAVFWVTHSSHHRAALSIVTTAFFHVCAGGCRCQWLLRQKSSVFCQPCLSRQVLYWWCKPGKAGGWPLLFPIFDAALQGVKKWEDRAALSKRLFCLLCKLHCAGELTVSPFLVKHNSTLTRWSMRRSQWDLVSDMPTEDE